MTLGGRFVTAYVAGRRVASTLGTQTGHSLFQAKGYRQSTLVARLESLWPRALAPCWADWRMVMSARTTPPFRADHVGSLLRPPELLRARDDFAEGRISAEEVRAVEDDAIRAAVRMQHDVGLQSATGGEFRRASWHMDLIYQLGGISKAEESLKVQFFNEQGTLEFTSAALKVQVHDKVRLEHTIFGACARLPTFSNSHSSPPGGVRTGVFTRTPARQDSPGAGQPAARSARWRQPSARRASTLGSGRRCAPASLRVADHLQVHPGPMPLALERPCLPDPRLPVGSSMPSKRSRSPGPISARLGMSCAAAWPTTSRNPAATWETVGWLTLRKAPAAPAAGCDATPPASW